MKSTFLKLHSRDFLKGLVMAILVPIVTVIQTSLDAGELAFNWKLISVTAVSSFIAYLMKNLFTDDVKEAQKTLNKAKIKT